MKEQVFTTNHADDPLAAFFASQCCACGEPMANSKFVNMVQTDWEQHWEYPQSGNVLTGEKHGATAVFCDDCIEAKAETKHVVELTDGKVILHPVSELQRMPEPEPYGICECGNELTEQEWNMFNGLCEDCHFDNEQFLRSDP